MMSLLRGCGRYSLFPSPCFEDWGSGLPMIVGGSGIATMLHGGILQFLLHAGGIRELQSGRPPLLPTCVAISTRA